MNMIPRNYIMLAGSVVLGALFGFFSWYQLSLRPINLNSAESKTYVLKKGVGVEQLSRELKTKKLIRSAPAFNIYVTLHGLRSRLQAGSYEFAANESTREIAKKIAEGRVAVNRAVFPEGTTIIKMKQILGDKGINPADFDAALGQPYTYDFLASKPAEVSLEGYLFPDSYDLIKPVQAKLLVAEMLENFGAKIKESKVTDGWAAQGLNLHQGLTLASIVEREVHQEEDRPMVAQLYLNRLKRGMPLQADPTAAYAGELIGKKQLDVGIDSPYNTYKVNSLPPGPICNPGISAMRAVANPKPNDYLYFISGKDGKNHFAKTLAEHEQNIAKYLK
ncbi:MAG TPA: endolytic transglycosylase MltG [Candidatus Dormibacteraeota bacterium]|nr:endolytic transglycosylase MltG [Candidatus Dormibacteraeota bacterium]